MPENVLPNNPYARPINATRPEGQMQVGEFYGKRATDKTLAGHNGRKVSPANRYTGVATAVPVDMDAPEPPKPKRGRPPKATPNPEPTSLNTDATSPTDEQVSAITEDDLFG